MKENTVKAISYICVAAVVIFYIVFMAWVLSPTEFVIKLETDDNCRIIFEEALTHQKEENYYSLGKGIKDSSIKINWTYVEEFCLMSDEQKMKEIAKEQEGDHGKF